MTKKTEYVLLPMQYKFLYDIPEDKLNKQRIYNDISLYQGGMTCVPGDTEYLSPTGWKTIDTLEKTDLLGVYHSNGTITFENPKEVFKWPADTWYNFNTRYTHQCLCPNHRIIYFSDKDREMLNPKVISCKEFVDKGCNQHYKIRNYFKSNSKYQAPYNDIELRLIVAYQADGYDYQATHKNKNSKRFIGFHLKKQEKIERLINLLKLSRYNFTAKVRENGIKKGYVDIFVDFDIRNYKHFPDEWYSLNDHQLSIIFDEVKHWDCSHKNAGSTEGSWTYSSNNKKDRDFIQFVCASQGYCTTAYERSRDITITQQGKQYNYKNKTEYTVNWTKGKSISLGKASMQEAKGGDAKYCPSTSTGMWLARYKNYIFVTGNS